MTSSGSSPHFQRKSFAQYLVGIKRTDHSSKWQRTKVTRKNYEIPSRPPSNKIHKTGWSPHVSTSTPPESLDFMTRPPYESSNFGRYPQFPNPIPLRGSRTNYACRRRLHPCLARNQIMITRSNCELSRFREGPYKFICGIRSSKWDLKDIVNINQPKSVCNQLVIPAPSRPINEI